MTTEASLAAGANDYFIAHPPHRPKYEVAAYVESEGLLVPPRFDTIEEAEHWPHGFILRSEHPLEYAGPSDMLVSVTRTPAESSRGSLKGFTRDDWRSYQLRSSEAPTAEERKLIAEAYGYTPSEYEEAIDFSVWGIIRGINRTIFADPASSERYFLGSVGGIAAGEAPARALQALGTDGSVETVYDEGFDGRLPEAYGSAKELIKYYETIRGLGRFEAGHNPIIELQSDDQGNQWFLQYHRGRESGQAAFAKAMPPGVPMPYAIGATHPDGEDLEVAVAFADGLSIAHPFAGVRTELLARANVPTMIVRDNLPTHFLQGLGAHASRSIWSKTPLALFVEASDLGVTELLGNTTTREVSPGVEVATTRLHVVSNGLNAVARL